jgi:hypothetical protein
MRDTGPTSVSLIVCESVLNEPTGAASAIRILDVLKIGARSIGARFFVLTYLHSKPFDSAQHVTEISMLGFRNGNWVIVASTAPRHFAYSYAMVHNAPGAFMLTTEFNLDLATLGDLGTFWIQLLVDGELVEQTPLTLQRQNY